MVVMAIEQYEGTQHCWTVYLETAKMINFMCILPQVKKKSTQRVGFKL